MSQKSKRNPSKRNPGRQSGAQNPAMVDQKTSHDMRADEVVAAEKPELLRLSGGFENLLAQPLVLPLGRTMTTFASQGQIPWPGYMSPNTELSDAGLVGTFAPEMAENVQGDTNPVGTFNDVFQLKAPGKMVTEAEKALVEVQRAVREVVAAEAH